MCNYKQVLALEEQMDNMKAIAANNIQFTMFPAALNLIPKITYER